MPLGNSIEETMSDDAESPTSPGIFRNLRKTLVTLVILFILWCIFHYAAPYFLFPHGTVSSAPTSLPATNQPVSNQSDEITRLKDRVDHLEAQLKTLEDVVAASPKQAGGSGPDPRVDALEA